MKHYPLAADPANSRNKPAAGPLPLSRRLRHASCYPSDKPYKTAHPCNRVLVICLPRLPMDRLIRLRKGDETHPGAITNQKARTLNLLYLNQAAEQAGLAAGMTIADARAIQPDLKIFSHNPERDNRYAAGLCRWLERYAPAPSLEVPTFTHHTDYRVYLDISGVSHLFDGEEKMALQLYKALRHKSLQPRIAIADNHLAALCLTQNAHPYEQSIRLLNTVPVFVLPGHDHKTTLQKLPVDCLPTERDNIAALKRLGLRTIEQVISIDRASLAVRFGPDLITMLDQLLGQSSTGYEKSPPPSPFFKSHKFSDPVVSGERLMQAVSTLANHICTQLEACGKAALKLDIILHRTDGSKQLFQTGFAAPNQDAKSIVQQVDKRISEFQPRFGVDLIDMRVSEYCTYHATQMQLNGSHKKQSAAYEVFSRIANRFGFSVICRNIPYPAHAPERSFLRQDIRKTIPELPAPTSTDSVFGLLHHFCNRPLFLFAEEPVSTESASSPPQHFTWRGETFHLKTHLEAEDISDLWMYNDFYDEKGLKTYWWVQTREGPRLWLCRNARQAKSTGKTKWTLRGAFL